MISIFFSEKPLAYTGEQLKPHFLLRTFNLRGTAIGAFIGKCDVKTEHLVDWEDRLQNDRIEAAQMIHFLGEFFEGTLTEAVTLQLLFMAIIMESLMERGIHCRRSGDDIYINDKKLSVSIVTASPVSRLLHIGINIDPTGAPVPAIGLSEIGVVPESWAKEILRRFQKEVEKIRWATSKVMPVI